jgi:membrane-associated phospholipid phosphatase
MRNDKSPTPHQGLPLKLAGAVWSTVLGRWTTIYSGSATVIAAALALGGSWRLGVLVLILLVLIGLALLFAHIVERYGYPFLELASSASLRWLRARDYRLTRSLHDLLQGLGTELPLVLLLIAVAMGGVWLLLGVLEDVVSGDPLVIVDQRLFQCLQSLRTPAAEALLVVLTELGDRAVILPVVVITTCALLLIKRWWAAVYVVLAALSSTFFVLGMKLVLHRPRPLHLYDGMSEFSFPSGHATSSIVVYGFLAILLARSAAPWLRRSLISITLSLIVLIAFSRLYLGAHWLSDVGAGLAFGTTLIASLAVLYLRQDQQLLPGSLLAGVLALTVIIAGTWHITQSYSLDRARYASPMVTPDGGVQRQ